SSFLRPHVSEHPDHLNATKERSGHRLALPSCSKTSLSPSQTKRPSHLSTTALVLSIGSSLKRKSESGGKREEKTTNVLYLGTVQRGVQQPHSVAYDCKLQMEKEATADEVSEVNERTDGLVEMLDSFQSCFLSKEPEANDELSEIKNLLIEEFIDVTRNESNIGVKQMGQLDEEVFLSACKWKGATSDAEREASLLCSKWQNEIGKPDWNPFRITVIDGKAKEDIVDDEKLVALKEEWGVDAYNAVVRALHEMNKYNPSTRHPVPELWNFKEDRKASVSEVVGHVMKDMTSI
ncbi:hypothetical protein EJB05_02753, partial [Eragrostis curvula]